MSNDSYEDFDPQELDAPQATARHSKQKTNSRAKLLGANKENLDASLGSFPLDDDNEEWFSPSRANKAEGNYLLTVGYPTSGKSTLHSQIYRLGEKKYQLAHLHMTGDKPGEISPHMEAKLDLWKRKFAERETIDGNAENELYEVAFAITPPRKRDPKLDLRIIEVAGEDLRKLDSTPGGHEVSRLPEALEILLNNRDFVKVKITVAFIVDPSEDAEDVEFLVNGFLSYMRANNPERLRHISFAVIISKPMEIVRELKLYQRAFKSDWDRLTNPPPLGRYKEAKDVDQAAAQTYIKCFRADMWRRLRNETAKAKTSKLFLSKLYIGDFMSTEYEEDGERVKTDLMVSESYKDTDRILGFIYHSFTGRELNPKSFWNVFLK